jgi:hypothetical protein
MSSDLLGEQTSLPDFSAYHTIWFVLSNPGGADPVAGALIRSTADEVAIGRVDPRAGEVVVHFPHVGFKLAAAL